MTIPSRREAARLLASLGPPAWFVAHACAVADTAAWLARRAAANGHRVDQSLVATAALLHDVDKLPSVAAPGRHGEGSAAWLAGRGMGELAPVVRDHPVTRLADDGFDAWARTASSEARIVAYADKRAGQRLESMAARFSDWRRRYPSESDAVTTLVAERAEALERDICGLAGVAPAEVRRLRWSRRALSAAGAAKPTTGRHAA